MRPGPLTSVAQRLSTRNFKAFLRLSFNVARGTLQDLRASGNERASHRIQPENLVWIFGSGRTGSTWMVAMMDEIRGQSVWFEPRVGTFFDPARLERGVGVHFILHPRYRAVWLRSIRTFVLDGADARFPEVGGSGSYLIIKEPGGSVGAPLLMDALPKSRMVLLVRDPRDVVASWLDASSEGGWQHELAKKRGRRPVAPAAADSSVFVRNRATWVLERIGNAKRAYDAHKGLKVLVRYEELRADTLATMCRLYDTLEIPVETAELARAVRKHSWENIPAEQKGERKFYRKATPGSWRQDLTPEQARIVERVTAPLLRELYPDA